MTSRLPPDDDAPLPGAVMSLQEERKLVRKEISVSNDNWSMRVKKRAGSQFHYSDDDDHDHTVPI